MPGPVTGFGLFWSRLTSKTALPKADEIDLPLVEPTSTELLDQATEGASPPPPPAAVDDDDQIADGTPLFAESQPPELALVDESWEAFPDDPLAYPGEDE